MFPHVHTYSLNDARKFVGAVFKNLKAFKCRRLMSKKYITISDWLSFSMTDHIWENNFFSPFGA